MCRVVSPLDDRVLISDRDRGLGREVSGDLHLRWAVVRHGLVEAAVVAAGLARDIVASFARGTEPP